MSAEEQQQYELLKQLVEDNRWIGTREAKPSVIAKMLQEELRGCENCWGKFIEAAQNEGDSSLEMALMNVLSAAQNYDAFGGWPEPMDRSGYHQ